MPIMIPAGNARVAFHPPLLDPSTRLVVLVNKVDEEDGCPLLPPHFGFLAAEHSKRIRDCCWSAADSKFVNCESRCIQSKTYKEAKNGFVGTEATAIQERKVFYTDNGRPVRDAGGIEPDIAVSGARLKEIADLICQMQAAQPGQLERELEKRDTFFKFATEWQKVSGGRAIKHVDDGETLAKGPAPVVTDEVYKEFQRFVEKEESEFEGPFDKSLELMQEALDQAGYGEAKNDVKTLQQHLSSLLMGEFDKNRKDIVKKLEIAIRQHYVPESFLLSLSLADDEQVPPAASGVCITHPNTLQGPQHRLNCRSSCPGTAPLRQLEVFTTCVDRTVMLPLGAFTHRERPRSPGRDRNLRPRRAAESETREPRKSLTVRSDRSNAPRAARVSPGRRRPGGAGHFGLPRSH
eukprot:745865-Hanusia_phi.AAC.1